MTDDIERKQRIWEEIRKEIEALSPVKKPGEFTLQEFAKEMKVSVDFAQTYLDKKISEGVIAVRRTKRANYYYLV